MLAEETLKIVIAVICIAFLVYFLTALYLKNQNSQNLELAKSSLEYLIKEIDSGNSPIEIYNPDKWILSSWSSGNLPNQCLNFGQKNCLCICNKDFKFWTDEKEECDEEGFCSESEFVVEGNFIKINPQLILKINEKTISKNGA